MAEKKITYNEKDKLIVKVLKDADTPMTLAEICDAAGTNIEAASITRAVNKGLVEVAGKVDVKRPAKREVESYTLITDEELKREDGKAFNYTDGEKQIMAVLKNAEAPMTLAEIADALGLEKLSSGAINGLTNKKGNVAKAGKVTREVMAVAKGRLTYVFKADIPTAE